MLSGVDSELEKDTGVKLFQEAVENGAIRVKTVSRKDEARFRWVLELHSRVGESNSVMAQSTLAGQKERSCYQGRSCCQGTNNIQRHM